MGEVRVESSAPILRVADLRVSLAYYTVRLGFRVDWQHEDFFAGISRGRGGLMLCQGHQGKPGTWVWFGVSDVDALHREFAASGATIGLQPTNYTWAREMHVLDPDGHVLRFGADPREPFADWVEWYREGAGGVEVRR